MVSYYGKIINVTKKEVEGEKKIYRENSDGLGQLFVGFVMHGGRCTDF